MTETTSSAATALPGLIGEGVSVGEIGAPPLLKMMDTDVNTVIAEACSHFNVTEDYIKAKGRERKRVLPRQMAMVLIRRLLYDKYKGMISLNFIGKRFDKDHATVMHAEKAIDNLRDTDKTVREEYDRLVKVITPKLSFNRPVSNKEFKATWVYMCKQAEELISKIRERELMMIEKEIHFAPYEPEQNIRNEEEDGDRILNAF